MIVRQVSFFLVLGCVFGLALPKSEEGQKQDRVYDRELSDKEHFQNEHHDPQYDHEAFLGQEAKTFDQLPPEESKRRLSLIVDRIDNNNDGFVSREELKDWIRFTQKRYISEDVDRQWRQHNPENEPTIAWEKYKKTVYGFLDSMTDPDRDSEGISYKQMLKRDRRRVELTVVHRYRRINERISSTCLSPIRRATEKTDYLRDIVVLETMEDIDMDQEVKVSLKEYTGDMYRGDDNEEDPEWVNSQREQFNTYRDKDGHGFVYQEEVKHWIRPPDFHHVFPEARRLMYEEDSDADEQLTKKEIISNYDLFVGSQVTDFGEALSRHYEF